MKLIKLTKGKFAIVDEADFDWLNRWKWTYNPSGYAYRRVMKNRISTCIYMHRLIAPPPANYVVDHVNGDGADNRRQNLRVGTQAQNLANRLKLSSNSTGYKGVIKKPNGLFVAQMGTSAKGIGRSNKYLGTFEHAQDAARAYDKEALERFGEFAKLNITERPLVDIR